jgi:Gpi18-like mannosyltransferase
LISKNKNISFFITYAVILFLPEVLMNSGIWGQCDSGYTMFIVLALLYLLKEKYIISFVYLGIAFSLKLQFIFILPLFIVIYVVKKRYSILHFLIIPLVNFILCLPAIIIGKPIGELISIYFGQVNEYKQYMSLNFLNLYSLVDNSGKILYYVGIILTVIVCFLMLLYIIVKKVKFNDQKILNLGLWFVVMVTYLLPCMHERYLYMGGILAVIYYIVYKKNYLLTISIIMCTILTYFHYLFGLYLTTGYKAIFSVGYLIVIAYYTKDLLYMLNQK